jgi:DNA-binding phage protein
MEAQRTGAERYFARRLEDADYREAYKDARKRIGQIDAVIRSLDERRSELNLTKAALARRAGIKPEAVRRLFAAERPNPTLSTLVALAAALDLELRPEPRRIASAPTAARSDASRTRRRTA